MCSYLLGSMTSLWLGAGNIKPMLAKVDLFVPSQTKLKNLPSWWKLLHVYVALDLAASAWRSSSLTWLLTGRFLIMRQFRLGLCIYVIAFNCLLDMIDKKARCDIVLDALQDFLIDMPRIWGCFVTALPHVGPWFLLCIPTALNNLTVVLSSILIWECHLRTCDFAWS